MENRNEGNKYFARQKYEMAAKFYTAALLKNSKFNDEKKETTNGVALPAVPARKKNNLQLQLLNNRALCYLQLHEYQLTAIDAKNALEIDKNSFKSKYRLICAYKGIGYYLQALNVLKSIVLENIESESIQKQFIDIQTQIRCCFKESIGILEVDNKKVSDILFLFIRGLHTI